MSGPEQSVPAEPQKDVVRLRARVRGRVQQVGFRMYVLSHAGELGLRGQVANRDDGAVECVVEGPRAAVDHLVALLHRGPGSARVDAVETAEEPVTGTLPPMRVTA